MTGSLIAQVKVTDDAWRPDCTANAHDIVARRGGRYLSRSANVRTIEGEGLDITAIAHRESLSMQAFEAFANDPEYAPFGAARRAAPDASAGFT